MAQPAVRIARLAVFTIRFRQLLMRTLRWIVCIPAGFLASLILGALAQTVGSAFGGAGWYVWLIGGAASAFAFFGVAFRVAPSRSPALKWALVAVVGGLGLMAAVGPLLAWREPVRAFAGFAMVFMAVSYAKMSVAQIEADIAQTVTWRTRRVGSTPPVA